MDRFIRVQTQGRAVGEYVVNLEQVAGYDVRTHELHLVSGMSVNVSQRSHKVLMKAMGFPDVGDGSFGQGTGVLPRVTPPSFS